METCDDGNARPGDGCSGVCLIEPNYRCPVPGAACVSTLYCGDGKVTAGESCDDGNTTAGDGCSADCKVEGGYACSVRESAMASVAAEHGGFIGECGSGQQQGSYE